MTERDKQIEEMTGIICGDFTNGECLTYGLGFACNHECESKAKASLLYDAGYRKQSGWISVEERLPTEEEYRDEYRELIPILVTEKDTIYPYRALYDGKTWGDGLTAITTITHWMPLPEPPKGE